MTDVHQIWHGDSIELTRKFKPGRVNCVITDPPFGVDNQSNMAVTAEGKKMARKIANDETPEIAIATFKSVFDSLIPAMAENSDIYVFTSYQVLKDWMVMTDEYFGPHGYKRKALLVWEKEGPGMGDLDSWGMGCEFILFFRRGTRPRTVQRRNNVLHYPQVRPGQLIHPHEKPLTLLGELIRQSTDPTDFLVDPFGGSGSLVRAARQENRNAVAIEYDEFNYQKALEKLNATAGRMF